MTNRWDETWHRLREWTNGQGPSERLAAQILLAEGFTGVNPTHPLGGKDGGKDAVCTKDGNRWAVAVYFPRGQQSKRQIKEKFKADATAAKRCGHERLAFITNQELSLSERSELARSTQFTDIELYHLERITALLDSPQLSAVRRQFLQIDLNPSPTLADLDAIREEFRNSQRRTEGLQTGGDSFCYWMLYHFDLEHSLAKDFTIIKVGEFPLYDLRVRIVDTLNNQEFRKTWGEISAPAECVNVKWQLRETAKYRIHFHARNGQWTQHLLLRRSPRHGCWLAATSVMNRSNTTSVLEHLDHDFIATFGTPDFR